MTLYDLVDGGFQEGALDELLAEVRMKIKTAAGAPRLVSDDPGREPACGGGC